MISRCAGLGVQTCLLTFAVDINSTANDANAVGNLAQAIN
jgi:hypothetical protein